MTKLSPHHNKICKYAQKLADDKNVTKKKISETLTKYGIDINYDDSIILATVCLYEKPNYRAIRCLLDLGADPTLIMENDLIVHDMVENGLLAKARLDGIFRLYGYECEWNLTNADDEKVQMDDLDFNRVVEPTSGEEDQYWSHQYHELQSKYRDAIDKIEELQDKYEESDFDEEDD